MSFTSPLSGSWHQENATTATSGGLFVHVLQIASDSERRTLAVDRAHDCKHNRKICSPPHR